MAAWNETRQRHEEAWLAERRMDVMATIARARDAQDRHDRRPGTQLSVLPDALPQTEGPEISPRPLVSPSARPLSDEARGENTPSKIGVPVPPQPGRANQSALPNAENGPGADGDAASGSAGTPNPPRCMRRPHFYSDRRCRLPRGHAGRCE